MRRVARPPGRFGRRGVPGSGRPGAVSGRGRRPAGLVLGLLLAVTAVLSAGCADAPVTPGSWSSSPSAAAPLDPAQARTVDVAYARAMIPHHTQALELSALPAGRTTSPDVTDLAFRIDREQVEEVGQLQGLLRSWGVEPPADGDTSAMSGAPGMGGTGPEAMGMAAPDTLAGLRAARGPTFDRLWLAAMTAHHRGAVDMARAHLTTGADTGLRTFSEVLVRTQQAEIGRMTAVAVAAR